jgi:hypothetical protein
MGRGFGGVLEIMRGSRLWILAGVAGTYIESRQQDESARQRAAWTGKAGIYAKAGFARINDAKGARQMARMGYWRESYVQGTFGPSERNFGVVRFPPILRYSIGNASGKGIL